MVHIESSQFPLYDRNPRTFVPNIFLAKPGDYRKQEVTILQGGDTASGVLLPVVAVDQSAAKAARSLSESSRSMSIPPGTSITGQRRVPASCPVKCATSGPGAPRAAVASTSAATSRPDDPTSELHPLIR